MPDVCLMKVITLNTQVFLEGPEERSRKRLVWNRFKSVKFKHLKERELAIMMWARNI